MNWTKCLYFNDNRIHVMAGLLPKAYTNASSQEQQQLWQDYSAVYVSNMQYAADLFHKASTKMQY